MSWGLPSISRMYGESDAELRERIEAISHRRALREVLAKLGIKSAREPEQAVIKINGTTIAISNAQYTISHDIKPIDVLGKFEVEDYE